MYESYRMHLYNSNKNQQSQSKQGNPWRANQKKHREKARENNEAAKEKTVKQNNIVQKSETDIEKDLKEATRMKKGGNGYQEML